MLSLRREVVGYGRPMGLRWLPTGLSNASNTWIPFMRTSSKYRNAGVGDACLMRQKEAPKGIDVVYDPVGGSAFQEALKVVNWGAQILIIGFASGSIPKV
jgi:hypothetical protein